MNEQAKAAKAAYMKEYRAKEENKIKLNGYAKEYRKNNPEKTAASNERYWTKKAAAMNG